MRVYSVLMMVLATNVAIVVAINKMTDTNRQVPFVNVENPGTTINANFVMTIKARSQLDCALYCIRDSLCQTVSFNSDTGLCNGHSPPDNENSTSAVSTGDVVFQVETPCKSSF